MFTKRALTVLLVGINLILALALVLSVSSGSTALAAQGRSTGSFMCVTAKATGQTYDVVYLLDSRGEKLHALYPINPQFKKLGNAQFRDLKADFGS